MTRPANLVLMFFKIKNKSFQICSRGVYVANFRSLSFMKQKETDRLTIIRADRRSGHGYLIELTLHSESNNFKFTTAKSVSLDFSGSFLT